MSCLGPNVIPYLVQADCARGILRAVLLEYNGETPKEYLERLIADTINGNKPGKRKVVVAWCYEHCIGAVRGHVRAENFICQPGIDKKNILNVRTNTYTLWIILYHFWNA